MGGLGIHVDTLNERPHLVKGFVKASLKGLKFMHARKSETVKIMMHFMRMNDREMVEAVYDFSLHAHPKDGLLTPDTQSEIIAITLEGMGRSGEMKPEGGFDFKLVKDAARDLAQESWKP
jgi:ABC-type nitrate/sulfonate/bicarbonate transport system substrate-binding protein